jgi:hypothetical protein
MNALRVPRPMPVFSASPLRSVCRQKTLQVLPSKTRA